MTSKAIQAIAEKIYSAAKILFDERIHDENYKKNLMIQLNDYYTSDNNDERYLRNLQFMFDHWCKSLPVIQPPPKIQVVRFHNPIRATALSDPQGLKSQGFGEEEETKGI